LRHKIEFTRAGSPDVVITTYGTATLAGLNAYLEELSRDPRWQPGMTLLVDHRALDWKEITTDDLRARAQTLASLPTQPKHVAVVVGETVTFGLMRMLSTFTDDQTQRGVFYDIADGYAWLAAQALPAPLP
jgi:hypothetical protein